LLKVSWTCVVWCHRNSLPRGSWAAHSRTMRVPCNALGWLFAAVSMGRTICSVFVFFVVFRGPEVGDCRPSHFRSKASPPSSSKQLLFPQSPNREILPRPTICGSVQYITVFASSRGRGQPSLPKRTLQEAVQSLALMSSSKRTASTQPSILPGAAYSETLSRHHIIEIIMRPWTSHTRPGSPGHRSRQAPSRQDKLAPQSSPEHYLPPGLHPTPGYIASGKACVRPSELEKPTQAGLSSRQARGVLTSVWLQSQIPHVPFSPARAKNATPRNSTTCNHEGIFQVVGLGHDRH